MELQIARHFEHLQDHKVHLSMKHLTIILHSIQAFSSYTNLGGH
nr:MAG TPA: hypothetical protein [Caudoviricetes sp.]